MGLTRRLQADLCILGLSAIWGCSFVIMKRALADSSPFLFIAIRFCLASLPLFFLVPRGILSRDAGAARREIMKGGLVTGVLLFAGFAFQTLGLQQTTPTRSAFITSMYVLFTPLFSVLLGLRRPSLTSVTGAALATAGLYLLTGAGGDGGGFAMGEALTLCCAAAFAAHLLALDHYTRRHDRRTMAFLQVAVVGALAVLATLTIEQVRFVPTPSLWAALGVTSLIATALAFLVLSLVQSWTTPTRAAVVFAAEPVFAAVASWIVEGERLTSAGLAGAFLILCGVLAAELGPLARGRTEVAT